MLVASEEATAGCELGGKTVRFAAIAKGSGMIHPQMATMLCFITTDARVAPETLQRALVSAVDETFNTITVDGEQRQGTWVVRVSQRLADHNLGNPRDSDDVPGPRRFGRDALQRGR